LLRALLEAFMPLYYFNVVDEGIAIPDKEGSDLPNDGAAIEEGRCSARELLSQMIQSGADPSRRFVEVRNAAGTFVSAMTLSGLMRPQG
jgi:hypothetical protein